MAVGLSRLIVENFRCFRDRQEIDFRPLTLIYGPNSAGKSALIRAIRALAADEEVVPYRGSTGPFVLGFESRYENCVIRAECTRKPSRQEAPTNEPQDTDPVDGVCPRDDGGTYASFEIRDGDTEFAFKIGFCGDYYCGCEEKDLDFLDPSSADSFDAFAAKHHQYLSPGAGEPIAPVFSVGEWMPSLTFDGMEFPALHLQSPVIIEPVRGVGALGADLNRLALQGETLGFVNDWLGRLGLSHRLRHYETRLPDGSVVHTTRVVDGADGKDLELGLDEVGSGVSHLFPIVVAAATVAPLSICVQQPELHLHPRLQAELADFFIRTAEFQPLRVQSDGDGKRHWVDDMALAYGHGQQEPYGVQWIIETHSEMLVRRVQTRVRNKELRADDVSVLYVHPSESEGSTVMRLELDDDGNFKQRWPGGFFEESFAELFGN